LTVGTQPLQVIPSTLSVVLAVSADTPIANKASSGESNEVLRIRTSSEEVRRIEREGGRQNDHDRCDPEAHLPGALDGRVSQCSPGSHSAAAGR
jgi:hypothetical protein